MTAVRLPAGVGCGAAASGQYVWYNPIQIGQLLTTMIMAGPFLTGFTQTINDWCALAGLFPLQALQVAELLAHIVYHCFCKQ